MTTDSATTNATSANSEEKEQFHNKLEELAEAVSKDVKSDSRVKTVMCPKCNERPKDIRHY